MLTASSEMRCLFAGVNKKNVVSELYIFYCESIYLT